LSAPPERSGQRDGRYGITAHCRACGRWIGHEPRVARVHFRKLIQVSEKYRCSDNVLEADPSRFEQRADVAHDLISLCADVVADHRSRCGVNRYLP
jgi:hypothetical protein